MSEIKKASFFVRRRTKYCAVLVSILIAHIGWQLLILLSTGDSVIGRSSFSLLCFFFSFLVVGLIGCHGSFKIQERLVYVLIPLLFYVDVGIACQMANAAYPATFCWLVAPVCVAGLVAIAIILIGPLVTFFLKRWHGLSPTLRRGTKGLGFALFVSLCILTTAYYFARTHFSVLESPQGTMIEQKAWDWNATRVYAFLDAILAGIVAFAMLGAFTFIASLRKPEEDGLEDRISYLYSARHDGASGATEYLRKQVMLLGAAAKSAVATYTVADVSACGKFVKMIAKVEIHIINMMKFDTYTQEMPLKVGGEELPDFNEEILGWVRRVDTQSKENGFGYNEVKSHLAAEVKLTNKMPLHEMKVKLEIPPAGELRYEYTFETWQKAQDQIWFTPNRFVEKLDIRVINNTLKKFKLTPLSSHQDAAPRAVLTIVAMTELEPAEKEPTMWSWAEAGRQPGISPDERFICGIELCDTVG